MQQPRSNVHARAETLVHILNARVNFKRTVDFIRRVCLSGRGRGVP